MMRYRIIQVDQYISLLSHSHTHCLLSFQSPQIDLCIQDTYKYPPTGLTRDDVDQDLHVELPNKAAKVAVLEMLGKDITREFSDIADNE